MKYKKLVIILSLIFGVIALFVILSFTLFRTSSIELNFKNQTTLFSNNEVQERVIKSGNISGGTPVFAQNKNQIKQKLEKENPYLNVINIETAFPNKLIIHCAEREELFAIKLGDNLYYICDQSLKVLKMDTNYENSQNSAILLKGVEVADKSVRVGETLSLLNNNETITNLADFFAYNNKTISDIKGMFKTIAVTYEINYYTMSSEPVLTFTTFDDFEIKITLPNVYLIEKINLMLALVPKSYTKYKDYRLVIDINPENAGDTYCRYEKLN